MTIFSRNVRKISEMCGKCAENVRKTRKIPYCQVSHTHERTPGSVDRDPIVIWRPANDRTFAIPRLYGRTSDVPTAAERGLLVASVKQTYFCTKILKQYADKAKISR